MSKSEHISYLFGDTALSVMRSFIDRTTLFAFDLDGTLAPIVSEPCIIGIPDSVKKEFTILNEQAVVGVITGRSRPDALHHLGTSPRYLIGNHGAEGLPGWEDKENEFIRVANLWHSQLDNFLPIENRGDIVIENKGATLSIHYRHADNIRNAHALILHAIDRLVPQPRRIGGKYVENLIPEGAPDKGVAIRILMEKAGCLKGLFVGDDETDEDVFRLNDANLFTIRVGRKTSSGASFYLRGQNEIRRLIAEINSILDQLKNLKEIT
jgi:trehalose 6-phosphate phosphatase